MTTDGYCSHAPSLPARGWQKDDRTRATRVRADTDTDAQLKESCVGFELRGSKPVCDDWHQLRAVKS